MNALVETYRVVTMEGTGRWMLVGDHIGSVLGNTDYATRELALGALADLARSHGSTLVEHDGRYGVTLKAGTGGSSQ